VIRWRFFDPNPMRDLLEQMVQAAGPHSARPGRGEPMPINVHQTEAEVVVEAALPGVRPEDVEISHSDGILSIRARSTVAERDYFHQEIHGVEYQRQVGLPVDVRLEEAQANLEHGMLEIRIPKQRPRPPERIKISVSRRPDAGPTTIDAKPGQGYEEVAPPAGKKGGSATRKASGGAARARRSSPGSSSERAR
jgi:HSP20 family protein